MKKKIEYDKNGEVLPPNKNIVARTITRGKSSFKPVKVEQKPISKVSTPKFTDKDVKKIKEERQKQLKDFFKKDKTN